ncbi:acetyl-coenzyme A transporter 1 [Venturia canescens]|uniref:acetyl-coenzyme A transporter 1 n=1 Tax=Venturia canescens TaxID=32260 RepID=UPI001C9D124A|nr:acetyl-coenzyme A transporter 1 [Venturia canescens]XP_043270717.1 acetyl-coenzyme A transporter 1 [Venturia canescens]
MKRKADRQEETEEMEEGSEAPLIGHENTSVSDIKGDEKNIAFLLFLYLLQGIPLGLCSAIPMILQNRGVSYKQQAEFSFVQWPFSLKLLWAPLVDAIYVPRFGRRKTWLIPTQYLMGMFMLYLSGHVEHWLNYDSEGLSIGLLTVLFFILNVLAATQDIVVDGWALTMLKRNNVGYASTCNSVGQTAGYFLGYVLFMALESPEFCNGYLRSVPSDVGIVTLPGFLWVWGWVFVVITTLIAALKHEVSEVEDPRTEDIIADAKRAYDSLWSIMKLPTIITTAVILLTAKIGFSACDAVTGLKLVEAGVPKEKLALMAVPLIPLQIVLPLAISRYTSGGRPLDVYLRAMPYRLVFGLFAALLVWITPSLLNNGQVPAYYFVILIAIYVVHQIAASSMFVASMAFFAKISDPAVGGTYMTFLNTLCNLGGNWPATTALWFVDALTLRKCSSDPLNDCGDALQREVCTSNDNGVCETRLDGYYIESFVCVVIGFIWLAWGRRKIDYLQSRPSSAWKLNKRKS